ncbi:MAG: plasmid pRiA4b ORF-3 family protein [Eubacteriales bacterium]|nr:plasmid pRiA4b ORF-3 family protein [Eubacteriales bacterium]
MAGYVLKIVLEDTHPPVWRRVIVPEMVTFLELHEIIQIIFGWTGCHLHDFRIPSKSICIDDEKEGWDACHYSENETLIERFLLNNKWVRYTYDFGDEWRHRVIYEKTEESYEKRYASLLKARGDNFLEDSGGVWGENGDNRTSFKSNEVERQLKKLICPIHDNLIEEITEADVEKIMDDFIRKLSKNFKTCAQRASAANMPSQMSKKINRWKEFAEGRKAALEQEKTEAVSYRQMTLPFVQEKDVQEEEKVDAAGYVLEIVPGEKTNAELLRNLGLKEAADYCKYLQIPAQDTWTKSQMTEAIAQIFQEHPEYILYVFYEEEYKEFLRWLKIPCGIVKEQPGRENVLIKALSLGLADVSIQKSKNRSRARLGFAGDIRDIIKPLDADVRKQIYRQLKKFSEKLENLILVYGIVDFDSLYNMFGRIYHEKMDKTSFYRYVYWFARFNNLVRTAYSVDGTSYAASIQLDMESLLVKMKEYANDLEYVMFPSGELKRMAADISMRNDWLDILFTTLHFQFGIQDQAAAVILEGIFSAIMNGESLNDILDKVYILLPPKQNLYGMCELWEGIAALMLELELPMLKGRSRNEYAEEKGISPWQTGMTEEMEEYVNSRERHMSEFPAEIQEAMYQAYCFADGQNMRMLLNYQEKEKIKSEEFLYLLAEAHITGCEFAAAEKLIRKLERSSARGKQAASSLRQNLKDGQDIIEDADDMEIYSWNGMTSDLLAVSRPFVRETPKIGRNDPCPCGSGKKYKKCCGKNK